MMKLKSEQSSLIELNPQLLSYKTQHFGPSCLWQGFTFYAKLIFSWRGNWMKANVGNVRVRTRFQPKKCQLGWLCFRLWSDWGFASFYKTFNSMVLSLAVFLVCWKYHLCNMGVWYGADIIFWCSKQPAPKVIFFLRILTKMCDDQTEGWQNSAQIRDKLLSPWAHCGLLKHFYHQLVCL